ncbi:MULTISPECIES: DMT family transporter [Ochrobactrum]|uniref:DMT family transporter n=1 Tax=Ochrobactrum TaxID=528 RepID=UPI0017847FB5|nr:DMT family transporter [Ochrobactrum sp. AN78]MBD7993502.1 DMT family transporter [Ochrobactrum gallinarum]
MPIYELAALGAAICWALTGLISAGPAGHLGAFTFNQMRQIFVSFLLMIYVVATGTWHQLSFATAIPLFLSGVIGIFLGDTMLFATLNRLGPRRAGILFAMNAPIAAFLGWGVLGEELTLRLVAGITLTIVGVCFAIFFNSRRVITHALETVHGSWTVGISLGLLAATGQAVGSIIVRPVMESGIDPFLASLLRVGTAACCLSVLSAFPLSVVRPRNRMTIHVASMTALSGILALAMGMTLMLFALSGGETGIVSTISATTPVIILPMLWLRTGQKPNTGAWLGAIFVVAGLALILSR